MTEHLKQNEACKFIYNSWIDWSQWAEKKKKQGKIQRQAYTFITIAIQPLCCVTSNFTLDYNSSKLINS